MVLCGAVSAEDTSTGGGLNNTATVYSTNQTNASSKMIQNEPDPRIYGVIKNDTTPAIGAIINIKNPTNNSLITSGTTNSSGKYDIYFDFNLTATDNFDMNPTIY